MKTLSYALCLAALATACAGPSLSPGPAPERGQEPMTNDDALVVYYAGLDACLSDPRDVGMRNALSMADARILELPEELGADDVPIPILELLFDMLPHGMCLQMDPIEGADWSQGPPLKAQLTLHGPADELSSVHDRICQFMPMMLGMEPTPAAEAGLETLATPAGEVMFGIPESTPTQFLVAYGPPDIGPLGLGSLDLPAGVDPTLAFKLDMGRMQEVMDTAFAMMGGGPEAEQVKNQLRAMGLLGDAPMQITAALGHGEDRAWFASRISNYRALAEGTGTLVTETLSPADLRMVPADATYAAVSKYEPTSMLASMKMSVSEEEIDEAMDMVRAMIGLDIEEDLLGPLGTTMGAYCADSTGGGGLASFVLFASVDDGERIDGTMETLQGLIDGIGASEAEGYVRVREWFHADQRCLSLTFPGLPIPLEVSCALVNEWFLVGITPQALAAAVDHATGDAPGLLDGGKLAGAAIGSTDDLMSLTYSDTAATLDGGYGLMSLVCSALANAVRSPNDPDREPGLILPPFGDLVAGARPSIMFSRMEGDDLLSLGESDASMVTSATSFVGSPLGQAIMVGMGAGAFMALSLSAGDEFVFEEF